MSKLEGGAVLLLALGMKVNANSLLMVVVAKPTTTTPAVKRPAKGPFGAKAPSGPF